MTIFSGQGAARASTVSRTISQITSPAMARSGIRSSQPAERKRRGRPVVISAGSRPAPWPTRRDRAAAPAPSDAAASTPPISANTIIVTKPLSSPVDVLTASLLRAGESDMGPG